VLVLVQISAKTIEVDEALSAKITSALTFRYQLATLSTCYVGTLNFINGGVYANYTSTIFIQ